MKLIPIVPALTLTLVLMACGRPEQAPQKSSAPARAAETVTPALSPPSPPAPPATSQASTAPPAATGPSTGTPTAQQGATVGASTEAGKLEIRRLVLASRVVEREPELALAPRVNEPLLAFVEAKNDASEEERLIVTFEHESGTKVGFVELRVPGGTKRYRTWARTRNLKEPGNWAAVVRSEGGTELGRTAFTVTES